MIEDLNLTSREERLLKSVLPMDQSVTVSQHFKREGLRAFLWFGTAVALLIGLLVAEAFWYRWLTEEGGFILVLLGFFVFDMVLSPLRFRDELARTRLIRKLYRALEARGGQNSSGDQ
jgi:hypothetical protein